MAARRPLVLRGPLLDPRGPDRADAHPDGFVAVGADGRIEAAGPWAAAPGAVLDGSRRVVATGRSLLLPAFVDAHVHLPQLDVRARWGLPLLAWLERHVYPAEAAFADPDLAARTAERFFAGLAAAGVGAAGVFSSIHVEATDRAFAVAEASGLRIVMGKVLMDRGAPAALLEAADEGVAASLALAERWEGAGGGRLGYALSPRFAPACSADLLAAVGRAADDGGLRIQTHLAEQPDEIDRVAELFPEEADYLAVYERAGIVREGALFGHVVHASDDAYRRLARAGAAIAACPTSNAFLGSGRFPLERARSAGVTIAVGSDVGAGPQLSPLDVLRHLAYLGRPAVEELLWRGTAAGARALGLDAVCGRLAPGLAADVVVLEPPPGPAGGPLDAFAACVFRQPETRVVATLVEGRVVHGTLPV